MDRPASTRGRAGKFDHPSAGLSHTIAAFICLRRSPLFAPSKAVPGRNNTKEEGKSGGGREAALS